MKFKSKKVEERFPNVHPVLFQIVQQMDEWSQKNYNVELVITESVTTAEEDAKLNRVSDTHRTGRAVDVRTKGLSVEFIENFCLYFNLLYNKRFGAQTPRGPNLIHYKPHGTGPHFHIQIRRGLAMDLLNKPISNKENKDGTT